MEKTLEEDSVPVGVSVFDIGAVGEDVLGIVSVGVVVGDGASVLFEGSGDGGFSSVGNELTDDGMIGSLLYGAEELDP